MLSSTSDLPLLLARALGFNMPPTVNPSWGGFPQVSMGMGKGDLQVPGNVMTTHVELDSSGKHDLFPMQAGHMEELLPGLMQTISREQPSKNVEIRPSPQNPNKMQSRVPEEGSLAAILQMLLAPPTQDELLYHTSPLWAPLQDVPNTASKRNRGG